MEGYDDGMDDYSEALQNVVESVDEEIVFYPALCFGSDFFVGSAAAVVLMPATCVALWKRVESEMLEILMISDDFGCLYD